MPFWRSVSSANGRIPMPDMIPVVAWGREGLEIEFGMEGTDSISRNELTAMSRRHAPIATTPRWSLSAARATDVGTMETTHSWRVTSTTSIRESPIQIVWISLIPYARMSKYDPSLWGCCFSARAERRPAPRGGKDHGTGRPDHGSQPGNRRGNRYFGPYFTSDGRVDLNVAQHAVDAVTTELGVAAASVDQMYHPTLRGQP
jgi:hypothetical protein